jgi:glycosyltransferase involved in cell wall biosynthesis
VLIVEENAHRLDGHFPVRFAQLGDGYTELGFRVEVLTTWGWSRADETRNSFTLHRLGPFARQFRRAAGRLRSCGDATPVRRILNSAGDALAIATVALSIRLLEARMSARPDAVLFMGFDTEPRLFAALAGDGHWLVNQFHDPAQVHGWRSRPAEQFVTAWARRAERRREARGGRFRVAAANDDWGDEWAARAPFLDPVVIPIAGARELDPIPDARERLGLPRDGPVALVFGAPDAKRIDTVLDAFAQLDGWTLVIGGLVADVAAMMTSASDRLCLYPGVVDNTTRDQLLAAADLMVLSFDEGYERNSGTLMDAVSAGVPIVCSRRSFAGDVVEEFQLGPTFEPGDASSLVEAVKQAPEQLEPDVARRAREQLSNAAVARRQLEVLGVISEHGDDAPAVAQPERHSRISRVVERAPAHLARRRFRLYGIGNPKSGTTTIAGMFSSYRAAHEVDARRFVPLATSVIRGDTDPGGPAVRKALRWRSARYNLEVDGANFLTPFASTIAQLYTDAKFVLTIRDCFTWLDSRVERLLRYPPAEDVPWFRDYLIALYDDDEIHQPEEAPLRDAGLRPLASYLRRWARYNELALDLPASRLLVVRTEDIDDSIPAIACFAGVPAASLPVTHANRSPKSTRALAEIPASFIVTTAEKHCAELMERFWGPGWRELVVRTHGSD